MTEPLLEAVNLTKELGSGAGKVAALKGVSLALNGGELTLLMGPSGSGKTTLLSILGCMLTPTEGTVRICRAFDRRRSIPRSWRVSGATMWVLCSSRFTCFRRCLRPTM